MLRYLKCNAALNMRRNLIHGYARVIFSDGRTIFTEVTKIMGCLAQRETARNEICYCYRRIKPLRRGLSSTMKSTILINGSSAASKMVKILHRWILIKQTLTLFFPRRSVTVFKLYLTFFFFFNVQLVFFLYYLKLLENKSVSFLSNFSGFLSF